MTTLARISISPVKGFRLRHPEEVQLESDGVPGNRRFFVLGSDGERLRSSQTPWLSLVAADYDEDADQLTMRFPDGTEVTGSAATSGERIRTAAGTLELEGAVVEGPWEKPLSAVAGEAVRLVRADRLEAVANAPAGGGREPCERRQSDGAVLFGVYARVERPGRVRVGDRLLPA